MPKRLSDTRWSAHADAVKALMLVYTYIAEVLDEIAHDVNETGETCNTALGLCDRMLKLETGFFLAFGMLFWKGLTVPASCCRTIKLI